MWNELDSPIGKEAAELGMEDAPPPGDGGAVSAERACNKRIFIVSIFFSRPLLKILQGFMDS